MTKGNVNKNAFFNTIKTVMGVIYPVISTPYVLRVLLTENVGKINFSNSVVSYVSLIASLGVSTYAIKECSKVRDNKTELSLISSEIFSINLLSTFIAYVSLAFVLIFARPLDNYRILICIQSTNVLFSTLGADWLNTAMEDFKYISIRSIVIQTISLILLFVLIHRPEDYIMYVVICVLASSGANIINIFYRRRYCKTRFTWKMNIRKHLPGILLMFSLILSQIIYVNSDMTILGLIKGDFETGLYSTSVKLYTIVNTTIASIAWVVIPQLTISFKEKNYNDINKLLKYALNYILVFGLPCICGIEIIAPQIIVTVAGEQYQDAALSLRILGFALLFSFFSGWMGNMIRIPSGQEKISIIISSVCAVINLVLNIYLIPIWGLNAAAFTTAVSEFVALVWGIIILDKNIKISELKNMLVAPIVGCIGILIIGFFSQIFLSLPELVSVATVLISIIWYCTILIVLKNEFFMGFIHQMTNKIRRA